MPPQTRRLAVLIDADNVAHNRINEVWKKAEAVGVPTIRRAYRNWANTTGWDNVLIKYAIQPMQPFGFRPGKNGVDIAMVIDALDISRASDIDGIVIVSGDSDFAPLAMRLRQQGLYVMGMGGSNAAQTFRQACDTFMLLGETQPPPEAKLA